MVEIKIDTKKVEKFTDRLVTDEKFRETFQANPKMALAEFDLDIPSELLPDKIDLPSPEEIKKRKGMVCGWVLVTS